MPAPDREQITDILRALRFNQTYTWPLINDTNEHYKFYNTMVKSVSQRRTPSRTLRYTTVCTWGKIDTHGRSDARKPQPLDEDEVVENIYNILSKKMKRGYRLAKATEYTVITDHSRAYTSSLNSSDKLSKSNKKSGAKKKKDSNDKRFDDLII